VFQTYDGERGAGVAAAAKYGVTGYPTLVVLDGEGREILRFFGAPKPLGDWLQTQSLALAPDAKLEARLAAKPDNLGVLWLLANRAKTRGDAAAASRWLSRIEAADKSPTKVDAANAAWARFETEMGGSVRRDTQKRVLKLLPRYPSLGGQAVRLLAATGTDAKTVEAALKGSIGGTTDPGALNDLIYLSLSLHAYDAALEAAQKQLKQAPDDPNSYDSLAEVYNYRGDRKQALATEDLGLAKKPPAALAAAMLENRKRFETGGPTPDVGLPPRLAGPTALAQQQRPPARNATDNLYRHAAAELGAKCADQANGLDEAYVRVQVSKTAVEKVVILDPEASPGLRKCLDEAIRGVTLPADTEAVKVTLPIPLTQRPAS
jgi:tetratricopeptide (TPR) repeat protein